ncbi:MAG: DUF5606 family protein [Cyclobacteriaceae bacterium]
MNLKDIATIAGKPGLFKILKPSKTSVIIESLDEKKTKLIATAQHRLSVLDEISIYTTTTDGSTPLQQVFETIHAEFGDDLGVDKNSDGEELQSFLKHVLPEYDTKRVYHSNIKKLIRWYGVLLEYAPEIFSPGNQEEE